MPLRRLASVALLLALAALSACAGRVPTLEQRAYALDRQFMCPICDGQTLDESNSQLSKQMKEVIREKLAAGETDEQVRAYFSDPSRYGLAVLAAPPASGFNLVLWVMPVALALAGGTTVIFIIRSLRRQARRSAAPVPATLAGGKASPPGSRYLSQVDADLGLARAQTATADAPGPAPHVPDTAPARRE